MIDYDKFYRAQARREENYRARIAKSKQKRLLDIMCENASKRAKEENDKKNN